MHIMIIPDTPVDTLVDAMEYAITMSEAVKLLGSPPPASAMWLTDGEATRMFAALPTPNPWDVVQHGERFLDLREVIMWRYAPDPTADQVIVEFLDHRDELEAQGIYLIDQIIVSDDGDTFVSLAVHTFSDREGWDNLSGHLS